IHGSRVHPQARQRPRSTCASIGHPPVHPHRIGERERGRGTYPRLVKTGTREYWVLPLAPAPRGCARRRWGSKGGQSARPVAYRGTTFSYCIRALRAGHTEISPIRLQQYNGRNRVSSGETFRVDEKAGEMACFSKTVGTLRLWITS